jgi:hypothetical protein
VAIKLEEPPGTSEGCLWCTVCLQLPAVLLPCMYCHACTSLSCTW